MTAQRYRVLFEGEILAGQDVLTVKRQLAQLFRMGDDKIDRFFSGRRFVIKKDLDYQSAQKYEEAFRRAGAICVVEPTETHTDIDHSGLRLETYSEPSPQSNSMVCPNCNFEQKQSTDCARCGIIIEKFSQKPPEAEFKTEAEQIEEDFAAFVGNNADKYLSKFEKFNTGGDDNFAITWHWPAFFFGSAWMVYRKLYLWSIVAFVLSAIPFTSLLSAIAFAMSGNYLYYKHAKKNITGLRRSNPTSDLSATLAQAGGVNRWVIGLCIVLLIVVPIAAGVIVGFSSSGERTVGKIAFYTDYDQGLDQAYEQGKPVMLVFAASSDGSTKTMITDVLSDDGVAAASRQLVNIYIDVDKTNRQLMEIYRVKHIPAVFFLDYSGDTIMKMSTDELAKEFINNINYMTIMHSYSG